MTGQELQPRTAEVLDRRTGELVRLSDASTGALAELADQLAEMAGVVRSEAGLIEVELLDRLDRGASWTERVQDGAGRTYEIKAPSPTAGTEGYDAVALVAELSALIERGDISEAAAANACKHHLKIELEVPWSADPEVLAEALRAAQETTLLDVTVRVVKAEPVIEPVLAGIKALAKLATTADALARARVQKEPPARRVKVSLKHDG